MSVISPDYGSGSTYYSQNFDNIGELLQRIYDNNTNIILAKDVRDPIWTLWNKIQTIGSQSVASQSSLYSLGTPSTATLGGILEGSTFSNATISQLFDSLLLPYVIPVVNHFRPTVIEQQFGNPGLIGLSYSINVGSSPLDGSYGVRFASPNPTSLIPTKAVTGNDPEGGNTSNFSPTYSTTATVVQNAVATMSFRTSDMTIFTATTSIAFKNKRYYGKITIPGGFTASNPISVSAVQSFLTDSVIKGLSYSELATDIYGVSKAISFSNQFFVFAAPTIFGFSYPSGFYIDNIFSQDFTKIKNGITFSNEYSYKIPYDVWISNNPFFETTLISTINTGNSFNTTVINGGHQDLQSTTDYGNTTDNNMYVIDSSSSISAIELSRFGERGLLSLNTGNDEYYGIFGSDDSHLLTSSQEYYLPNSTGTLVLSLNGIKADNFGNVTFSSSGGSQSLSYTITRSEADILIGSASVQPGALYYISDRQIYLEGITSQEFSTQGIRRQLCPSYYGIGMSGSNDWIGVWNNTKSVSTNQLTIWGTKVWKNTTGSIGTASNNLNLDSTDWQVILSSSFSNTEYIPLLFGCLYDWENDWVAKQWDTKGNVYGIDYISAQLLSYPNLCDYSDWNWGTTGFPYFNNVCFSFSNNSNNGGVFTNTNKGSIFNNSNNGDISLNLVEGYAGKIWLSDISNNSNDGDIKFNKNSGSIDSNSNDGDIVYNRNAGDIYNNSNIGIIHYNSNNGYINNNQNNGAIESNDNNGWISDHPSTVTYIQQNSNNGSISNNSNSGQITRNCNGQDVSSNGANVTDIFANANAGSISNNNNTGAISSNHNNGAIYDNTPSVTQITYNKNNGHIQANSNIGYITFNSNNGNVSFNTSTITNIYYNRNNGDVSGPSVTGDASYLELNHNYLYRTNNTSMAGDSEIVVMNSTITKTYSFADPSQCVGRFFYLINVGTGDVNFGGGYLIRDVSGLTSSFLAPQTSATFLASRIGPTYSWMII